MTKHTWHKEIKAWADGAEIESRFLYAQVEQDWQVTNAPRFEDPQWEYRIKPQPKEPQYLYVYHGKKSDGEMGIWFEKQRVPYIESGYIGKIKLEQDDE
jgi:hypothetical protein